MNTAIYFRNPARRRGAGVNLLAVAVLLVGFTSVRAEEAESELPEETPVTETALPKVTVQGGYEPEGTSQGYRATHSNVTGFGNQSLLDTPHSINVITREVIEDQRATTLREVLKNDASVQIGSDSRFTDAQIRGFSLDNWQNYQRDGLKVINQARYPVENLERVEILKGLTGTYYGLGAPAGIINYVVKRPGPEPLTRFWLDSNHWGGYRVRGDVSRPLTADGRHAVRFNAAYEDLTTHVRGSGNDRYFFSGAYLGQLGPSTQLFIDADYHRVRDNQAECFYGLLAGTQVPQLPNPRRGCGQSWSFFNSTVWNVSARLDHAFTEWLSAQVQVLHNNLKREESGPLFASWDVDAMGNADVFDFTSRDEIRRPTSYRAALNARFTTGAIAHDLTGGFMASDFKVGFDAGRFDFIGVANQSAPFPALEPGTTPYDSTRTTMDRLEYGFYGMDTLSWGERWQLQVGVRHQEIDFRTETAGDVERYTDSATTPSAALIFKPLPFIAAYFGYMEGFEQGEVVRGGQFANTGAVLPPLKSRQMEFGLKAEFAPGYSIAAALFETDRASILDLPTEGDLLIRTQDGRQVHRGFELSFAGQMLASLRMIGSFMLLDAEIEKTDDPALEGNRPVNVPKTAASAFLDWNVPWLPGVGLFGGVFYRGNRAANVDNSVLVPGYTRFDLGARYATSLAGRGLVLRAGVNNLTNTRYWESALFDTLRVGIERTYWFTAQLDF